MKKTYMQSFKESVLYIIMGVFTTVVNFAVYYALKGFCGITAANGIAWAVSVVFAYFTNSRFVFCADAQTKGTLLGRFASFVGARIFSGCAETAGMYVFCQKLMWNDFFVKVALNIFVIVFNYIVSKFYIFKKHEN